MICTGNVWLCGLWIMISLDCCHLKLPSSVIMPVPAPHPATINNDYVPIHFQIDLFSNRLSPRPFCPLSLSLCSVNTRQHGPGNSWSWRQQPGSVNPPSPPRPDDHYRLTVTNANLLVCPCCHIRAPKANTESREETDQGTAATKFVFGKSLIYKCHRGKYISTHTHKYTAIHSNTPPWQYK